MKEHIVYANFTGSSLVGDRVPRTTTVHASGLEYLRAVYGAAAPVESLWLSDLSFFYRPADALFQLRWRCGSNPRLRQPCHLWRVLSLRTKGRCG